MLKRGVANEKREISSKDFIKKFIKNFIYNGLIIGIVFVLIYEAIAYFIKNNIIKEILYFATIFFAISKIHIAAVKDTFYDSYILGDNIRKSKNNVMIFFIIVALANIIWNLIPVIRMYSIINGFFGTSYLKVFIIQNIINVILYVIITIFCRDEIDKQCYGINKDEKKYLIKNIILVIIFAVIVITGTIFIDVGNINSSQKDQDNNSNNSNVNNSENNEIINEINLELELLDETNTEYPSYRAKSTNGEFEVSISSFETKITEDYLIEEVKDGVIVFYTGTEKNYIEKFDIQGNSEWKIPTPSKYRFDQFIEVADGYFMVSASYSNSFVAKINLEGKIISAEYIKENLTNITFIESEEDVEKGYAKIVGLNNQGESIILEYDNVGKQKNILNTNLYYIVCEKVIEKDGYYYGIGKDSGWHMSSTEIIFKLDNDGNIIFRYKLSENSSFGVKDNNYGWIGDISVNSNYIFAIINYDKDDVYVLDLNGTLKEKIGYDTQGTGDIYIKQIKATNEGIYVTGHISPEGPYVFDDNYTFIDKISNDFNYEYRFNIPILEESKLDVPSWFGRFLGKMHISASLGLYDDYLMVIHQYKFD